MASQAIHFGTSGWRGIIAEDFTFSGVRRAAAAIAGHLRASTRSPVVIVGYDTRFFSEEFARTAAESLRSHGCRVLICGAATPTPTIAHAIIHGKLDGGVNITASHNPAQYNGLKFSDADGGPALPEVTEDIEKRAAALKERSNGHHEIADDFERIDPGGTLLRAARAHGSLRRDRQSQREFRLRRAARVRRGLAEPNSSRARRNVDGDSRRARCPF